MASDLKKGARITGTARDKLAADLRKKYDSGQSIRALAESSGRSYGFVHRILTESGTTLRGRGGATRRKKADLTRSDTGTDPDLAGVRVERDGPVATVVLDRPDVLNAQTPSTWAALREAGRSLPGGRPGRGGARRGPRVLRRPRPGGVRARRDPGGARPAGAGGDAGAEGDADRSRGFQEAFTWLRRPD